jgi:hypothetical protein
MGWWANIGGVAQDWGSVGEPRAMGQLSRAGGEDLLAQVQGDRREDGVSWMLN